MSKSLDPTGEGGFRQGIGGRDCMEGMEGQVAAPSHWIGIGGGGSQRENDL